MISLYCDYCQMDKGNVLPVAVPVPLFHVEMLRFPRNGLGDSVVSLSRPGGIQTESRVVS